MNTFFKSIRSYLKSNSLAAHISIPRKLPNSILIILSIVGCSWVLFQLLIATVLTLNDIISKAIHLSFGMTMLFMVLPVRKKKKELPAKRGMLQWFAHSYTNIPLLDVVFIVLAIFAALYLPINLEALSLKAGNIDFIDIFMGGILVILVLEASRRTVGLPMVILVIVLALWAFFGSYMPRPFDFKSVELNKFIEKVAVSTEGIFGIPLYVATYTVFLFVLFGTLLERFGAGQFFNDLAIALLGKYRGAPAKASVISSGLSGMISGSSIANVVTTGTITIPLMKKAGFPARIAAATEVAASTNGQLMPPIMGAAAFIMAEYLGVSYATVIKAALIPALTSYIALFYIVHLETYKLNISNLKDTYIPNLWKVLKTNAYQLIPIVVLVICLAGFRFSPSFSVAISIFSLLITVFFRNIILGILQKQKIGTTLYTYFREVYFSLVQGAINMLPVTLATAAAGIIVGTVNMGIGGLLIQIVEHISFGNIFLLLFFIAVFSLLIGMGLPTTATYVVMATITVPIIVELGANLGFAIPLIAAHLYCFYFGIIADDTPPVGLAAYTAAAIAKTDPVPVGITGFIYDLRTAVIPFVFVLNPIFILDGVNGFLPGLGVFIIATAGGFAFTNFIQGYFRTKNTWYEGILLLVVSAGFYLSRVLVLRLQELFIIERTAGSTSVGILKNIFITRPFVPELGLYVLAALLYVGVYFLQKLRLPNKNLAPA